MRWCCKERLTLDHSWDMKEFRCSLWINSQWHFVDDSIQLHTTIQLCTAIASEKIWNARLAQHTWVLWSIYWQLDLRVLGARNQPELCSWHSLFLARDLYLEKSNRLDQPRAMCQDIGLYLFECKLECNIYTVPVLVLSVSCNAMLSEEREPVSRERYVAWQGEVQN